MNSYLLRKVLFPLPIILFTQSIFSQGNLPVPPKTETKWGVVSSKDMSMETYKLDPEAAAVILWDHGTWTPENWEKGKVRLFRHTRIKILKKEGLKYAKQEIRYEQGEKLGGFRAQTLNWDFEKNRAVPTKVETSKLAQDSVEGNEIVRSFTFPNVEVGSVIEFKYNLVANSFEELKPWYFQSEIPTRWSEVQTRGFYPYVFRSVPLGTEIKPLTRDIWRAKFISALPKEPFSQDPMQYRTGVRFYLTPQMAETVSEVKRWRDLRNQLQYQTYLDPSQKELDALYAIALDLTEEALTEEEKISLIHEHIREQVSWNGMYSLWVDKDPAAVYKTRKANGAEINMLLFYMLDMAGLKPEQVFVSTRGNGPATKFPLFNQFNHLLCRVEVGEQAFYLDATEKYADYDIPSAQVLNGVSVLLKDSTTHLLNLVPTQKASSLWMIQAELLDGALKLLVKESHTAYAALERRKKLVKLSEKPYINEDPFRPFSIQFQDQPTYKHLEESQYPLDLEFTHSLKGSSYIKSKGDTLWVSPLFCFSTSTPFQEANRKLAIDFLYPRDYNILINLSIPEGYKTLSLPSPSKITVANQSLISNYQINQVDDILTIQSRLSIKKRIVYPEDYLSLQTFYQKMIEKEQEPIILVKE